MSTDTNVHVPKMADLLKAAGIPTTEKRAGQALKRWFALYLSGQRHSALYEEAIYLLDHELKEAGFNRISVMSDVIAKYGQ